MGYQIDYVSVEVPVRLSRHNSERDERHDKLAAELRGLFRAMTRAILSSGKYDEILVNGPVRMSVDNTGVADDITLTLNSSAGVLYHMPLRMSAIVASINNGEILPFVYDRRVQDEDEEYAPEFRKGRLMVVDDGAFNGTTA